MLDRRTTMSDQSLCCLSCGAPARWLVHDDCDAGYQRPNRKELLIQEWPAGEHEHEQQWSVECGACGWEWSDLDERPSLLGWLAAIDGAQHVATIVHDLCAEIDRLRARAEELEAEVRRVVVVRNLNADARAEELGDRLDYQILKARDLQREIDRLRARVARDQIDAAIYEEEDES